MTENAILFCGEQIAPWKWGGGGRKEISVPVLINTNLVTNETSTSGSHLNLEKSYRFVNGVQWVVVISKWLWLEKWFCRLHCAISNVLSLSFPAISKTHLHSLWKVHQIELHHFIPSRIQSNPYGKLPLNLTLVQLHWKWWVDTTTVSQM